MRAAMLHRTPMASTSYGCSLQITAPRLSSTRHLGGSRLPLKVQRVERRSRQAACAYAQEWPDPQLIEETKEAFPDKGIANVEEARALVSSLGYTWLDVRPPLECEDVGKWRESVNIPIVNARKRWDSEQGKKVVEKEDNPDFVAQVEQRFPNKDTPLLIGCSNGRTYSMDALEALDDAGYTNLAGLKGGFYAWFRVFTNKGERRRSGEYQEDYIHDGDSCGIHSSGAGFDKVDKADVWVPPEY